MKVSKKFFFELSRRPDSDRAAKQPLRHRDVANQKTFVSLGSWPFHQRGLKLKKFFCFFFVHKQEVRS